MNTTNTAHVFLDTNTALHFRRPDQIDWQSLVHTRNVVLVASPMFLREIEAQKVYNSSKKVRERATAYVKWLSAYVRDPSLIVRDGTAWHFVPTEPTLNFAANNLSREIADDQLIASVLDYCLPTNGRVCVATADVGLEVKLRYRQIEVLLLPEELRLPDELDPRDKELARLRNLVSQERVPVLGIVTGGVGKTVEIPNLKDVSEPSAKSLAEMRRELPMLNQKPPKVTDGDPLSRLAAATAFESFMVSPERIKSYNEELEHFVAKYAQYLKDLLLWEKQYALTVRVDLSLTNEGTCPASDIDVEITFPRDIWVMVDGSLPNKPTKPVPPRKPESWALQFGVESMLHGIRPGVEHLRLPDFDVNRSVGTDDGCVTYWLRNLKHGQTEELKTVYLRFPNLQARRSFSATCKISAAEMPSAVLDRIDFVA